MSLHSVWVSSGVISERVADSLLVILPGRTDAVRLTGHPAELFLDIQAGNKIDVSDPAVADLIDLGILQASRMSRRGLIKAGAIGVGAGIAVMALPSVAAAASQVVVNLEGYWLVSGAWPPGQNGTAIFVVQRRVNLENFPLGVFTEATLPTLAVENSSGVERVPDVPAFALRALVPDGFDELEWREFMPIISPFDLDIDAAPYERFGTFTAANGTIYRVRFVRDDYYSFG